jgi:hypothetical protein
VLYLSYPYEVVDGVRFEGVGQSPLSPGKGAYPTPLFLLLYSSSAVLCTAS